ncbi:hypothetical protein PVK06_007085 [Gossypium arboreum]|uniref:Uncharacterized protein n=1 Tax=Gossypium arboreum TaxID=29729 RepID=A0ABR0QH51_GOSAR|nr:hypothetical protein PVK06_007085 [Gossypium arboreum]
MRWVIQEVGSIKAIPLKFKALQVGTAKGQEENVFQSFTSRLWSRLTFWTGFVLVGHVFGWPMEHVILSTSLLGVCELRPMPYLGSCELDLRPYLASWVHELALLFSCGLPYTLSSSETYPGHRWETRISSRTRLVIIDV